jgi:multiple sugar transport system ATP-binding protein
VATFLGSPPMNLLDGGDVIVGFRPEHLVPAGHAVDAAIELKLRTANTEYLGSEWIFYGRVDGERFSDRAVRARLADASTYQIGSVYDFAVSGRHLRFFDKQTERRTEPRSLS